MQSASANVLIAEQTFRSQHLRVRGEPTNTRKGSWCPGSILKLRAAALSFHGAFHLIKFNLTLILKRKRLSDLLG